MDEIWLSDDEAVESEQSSAIQPSQPIWQFLFFLLFWQSVFRLSNAALTSLLSLLKYFIRVLGNVFHCPPLVEFSELIPKTLRGAYSFVGVAGDDFIEYVVCPNCHSVYEYKDCFATVAGTKVSKHCCHIFYPNHPQRTRRRKCGALLLKKVRSGRGHKLVPIKVYPYFPLQKSLQRLVARHGFLNACEHWRARTCTVPETHLGDIYDGRIWHDFNSASSYNFLTAPLSYLVTLNVDWFQPFSHTEYSVGVIYLTIQNLPRSERFKEENIILIGVLPGPSEPKLVMNSYLTPLVEELKQGWHNGFAVVTPEQVLVNVRVALTCIACDIPASRKVNGFLGHHASLACNKCLKKFSVAFGSPINYSGFDRSNWVLRTGSVHRQQCEEIFKKTTKTGMRKVESKYGLHYSVLLGLPYFDPVRFTAIDTMHNLYLGTGKHSFKVWINKGLLTEVSLSEIDQRAKLIQVPSGIGRLPTNISSNYGGFKADQWRTWITIYSPVLLKGILPNEHLQCWMIYVRACSILSQRILKKSDLATADLLLLKYCEKFQELYGEDNCTMNLHLHLHLKETFLDFGPSHAFWCFPFERYNGILGSFSTKAVEVQFMRKLINSQSVQTFANLADPQLRTLLPMSCAEPPCTSIMNLLSSDVSVETFLDIASIPLIPFKNITSHAVLLSPVHEAIFPSETVQQLHLIYRQLYPHHNIEYISPFFERSGRVTVACDLLGSVLNAASSISSSIVMAYWPGRGDDLSAIDYSRMRVGVVQFYFKHSIVLYDEQQRKKNLEHIFACVYWKQKHPREDWFGISATVCVNMFEPLSACNFIPIQRINKKCAHCVIDVDFFGTVESVFIACPLPFKYSL